MSSPAVLRTTARAVPEWARALGAGAAAGAAGLIAMVTVAFGALLLLGVGAADLPRLVALVVSLALGTPVRLGSAIDTGFLPARFDLELVAMPLGVSLAGAVALVVTAAALPRRRSQPGPPRGTGLFVVGVAGGFLVSLAALLALGGGTGTATSSPGSGSVRGLPAFGDPHADASATGWHACAWLAVVLLVMLVCSGGLALPGGAERARQALRPAVLGVAVVVTATAGLLTGVAAAVAGVAAGPRPAGAILLGGPNAVLAALTRGLGADWHLDTGDLPAGLESTLRDRLASGLPDSSSVPVGGAAGLDVPLLLPIVGAVAVLLICGLVTAGRTPGGGPARVIRSGAALGLVTALTLALVVAATRMSLDVRLALGGLRMFDAGVGLRTGVFRAAALGLVEGAAAGALGALLVDVVRRLAPVRRVEIGSRDG